MRDLNIYMQELEDTTNLLENAITDAVRAVIAYDDAHEILEDHKAELIINGQVVGKNETERDANARSMLTKELRSVADTIRHRRIAEANVDALRFRYNTLKLTIEVLLKLEAF